MGVELKDVSFAYEGGEQVLRNIYFQAKSGQVTLIAGDSGQGKSTLLSIICGIIPGVTPGRLRGKVLLDGIDCTTLPLGQRSRKVGVVLQNADAQIVHELVEDEIAFGLENIAYNPRKMKAQIDTAAAMLKLDTTAATRSLSGGQKQRLITASTLAMGQKLLLLDEPLANLDTSSAAELMQTIRSLAEAGYAVIVVEHRLDLVLPYVDVVWNVGSCQVQRVEDKAAYLKSQTVAIGCASKSTAADNLPIFSLKNLAYEVSGKTILQDVTLDLPAGKKILLLGENGCGKTTLLRLLACLNRPSEGELSTSISFKNKREFYKKVGVVYQNPNYQLFMPTVRQEVEYGAISAEYATEIMEKFAITHLADRHPQSLSEGQKRRVSIAAVLATRPQVLLLDEPTVGQDYRGLQQLVRVLDEIHRQTGNTMITITHDLRCMDALGEVRVEIKNGRATLG